jgi:hypothetical protein
MSIWKKFLSWFRKEEETTNKDHCEGSDCNHSLHIGVNNYPGSKNDLRGCVNDATGWAVFLKTKHGFQTTSLLDRQATYKNVAKAMRKIVSEAVEGSHIVITFSGHGTNVRDVSGDEVDKRDEALCLYDKLLLDDELRKILDALPKGARLTFISDSCHSGTVTRSFLSTLGDEDSPVPRYLPPDDDEEAFEIAPKSVTKKIFTPEDMNEVLITGCRANEFSYDARINGKFQGAMSHFALKTLYANPDCTYDEFYAILKKSLPSRHYPQTPQLEGSSANRSKKMF